MKKKTVKLKYFNQKVNCLPEATTPGDNLDPRENPFDLCCLHNAFKQPVTCQGVSSHTSELKWHIAG